MLPPPAMSRNVFMIFALAFSALRVPGLSLSVQAPEDLWPEWLRLVTANPLPPGVEVIRSPDGASPAGDSAVLGLETAGTEGTERKVMDFIPLVPVSSLGDERQSATMEEVSSSAVRLLPLCAVSVPTVALPLDDLFPDQRGYPLYQKVMLRLDSTNAELQSWYSKLPEPSRPGTGPDSRLAWIEAVGDIMPARGVDRDLLADGGLGRVFGDALALLQGSDLLLGNLESSAASPGTPENKTYTFRFNGSAVGKLREAGFSYLSLANNHTFDFGPKGFLQTLDTLSRWGIMTSGAGRTQEEANRPAIMRAGKQEVRILSFGDFPVDRTGFDGRISERAQGSRPGILWLDDEGLAEAARAFQPTGAADAAGAGAAATAAFNIGFVHGGEEWRPTPTPEQKRLYGELARRGASLVLGAHPHVLEGMEAVDGSLIVYSLGNFLFPGMDGTPGGEDSIILRLGVYDGKVRYVQALPVRLQGGTVRRAYDGHALRDFLSRTRALAGAAKRAGEGTKNDAGGVADEGNP